MAKSVVSLSLVCLLLPNVSGPQCLPRDPAMVLDPRLDKEFDRLLVSKVLLAKGV